MPKRVPTFRPRHLPIYERERWRRADKAFYKSPRWRAVRAAKLRLNPLCEECEAKGLTVAAMHVHHILERKARPDLAFEITNLQSLCPPCHGEKRGHDG